MNARAGSKFKLSYLGLCVVTILTPQLVIAQVKDQSESEQNIEKISVVGSNIKVNRDTGALPITAISSEDINNSGALSGDQLLAEIPQVGDTAFNEARTANGVNDARGDVSSINLRSAGSGNTLTLLNGRRLVLHPGTQSEGSVPITTVNSNTLPVKGLKRVEVLRDGAGAIYGSDAVAGVVNYLLDDQYEGSEVDIRYGQSEGTSLNDLNLNGISGFSFNNEKSNLVLSLNYLTRNGMQASERSYAASEDISGDPRVPAVLKNDTDLDGRHKGSPWLEYSAGSTFHVRPVNQACDKAQPQGLSPGTCIKKGVLTRDLYYNRNQNNSLISDLERANLYAIYTQRLGSDLELFAEGIYYYAKSTSDRYQAQLISSQRFEVSKDAFYNPLGRDFRVLSYRPVDAGPRVTEVTDDSYRALVGLRSEFGDWSWETAALYSKAISDDVTYNWVRLDLLSKAANSKDQATAYNLFNGGDVNNPGSGIDPTANSQAVINSITDDIYRISQTELALVDFKLSTPDLFKLPMGDVGFASGAEFRYETFDEDRDTPLNTNFIDDVTGQPQAGSNALGNSPTLDSAGSRNVLSVYGELYIPLFADLPFADAVDLQLATRYESFNDIDQDVLKSKAALSWVANDYVQFRASYAQSFKAPGLPQVVTEGLARSNAQSDPVFKNENGQNVSQGVTEIRSGSQLLAPEESTNTSAGLVFNPLDALTLTVDYWQIEQQNTIGQLDAQTQILLDALLRSEGSSNRFVVRDKNLEIIQVNNPYLNLLPRTLRGIDYAAYYTLNTAVGKFDIKLSAAKMLEFSQDVDPTSQLIIDAQAAGNRALLFNGKNIEVPGASGSLLMRDGNPEWRGNLSIAWRLKNWSAGVTGRYLSSFDDTSVNNTKDNLGETIYLRVPSLFTMNVYANYKFKTGSLDGTKLTFGVRNIANKQPPLSSGPFGYNGSVHNSLGRYVYAGVTYQF